MRWPFRRRARGPRVVFVGTAPWDGQASDLGDSPPRDVRLGFADGSEVTLTSDDPTADALRDLADRLTARE